MTARRSRVVTVLLVAVSGVVLLVAPRVYRAESSPEWAVLERDRRGVVAPAGFRLTHAADERMRLALDALRDDRQPPTKRYRAYRGHLEVAERLLQAGLRSLPAQADALTRLAAVRYELDPPVTDEQYRDVLDMIDIASGMAPRVPDVQARLGNLLFRMGRSPEALTYHRRAVELDPGLSRDVVATLSGLGMSPRSIAEALPHHHGVLAALARPYADSGHAIEYLDLVDEARPDPDADLLAEVGTVAIAAGVPRRFLATYGDSPVPSPRDEAERLRQVARARAALGDLDGARDAADAACRTAPDEPGIHEDLGNVALRQGDHGAALAAFRDALAAAARRDSPPRFRARMYRRIGVVEEARGRPELAYDAFRRAVALDPDDPVAAKRLREMREAAGIRPGVR